MDPYKRQKNGRFAEGNCGGPGRPPRKTERDYLLVFESTVTPERWQKVLAKILENAESGNLRAAEFLAKYMLGNKQGLSEALTPEEKLQVAEARSPSEAALARMML
jgi:hypothetical protein